MAERTAVVKESDERPRVEDFESPHERHYFASEPHGVELEPIHEQSKQLREASVPGPHL